MKLRDRILPQSEVIRAILLECSPCCGVTEVRRLTEARPTHSQRRCQRDRTAAGSRRRRESVCVGVWECRKLSHHYSAIIRHTSRQSVWVCGSAELSHHSAITRHTSRQTRRNRQKRRLHRRPRQSQRPRPRPRPRPSRQWARTSSGRTFQGFPRCGPPQYLLPSNTNHLGLW